MRYFQAMLLLGLLIVTADGYTKNKITTCLDYSPYFIETNGEKTWNGRNIEVLNILMEQLSYELDTSIRAPFIRCMKLLESGTIDVIAGLIFTEQRQENLLLIPYGRTQQLAIYYLKSEFPNFSLGSLPDSSMIGAHRAFALPQSIKDSELVSYITPVTTIELGMEMTVKNRLSGVLASVGTGYSILSARPDLKQELALHLLNNTGHSAVHLGINKTSALATKTKQIESILATLKSNPKYAHLKL